MTTLDSDSPEGLGMMRGEQIESCISDAHPHEIIDSEKTKSGIELYNLDSQVAVH